MHRTTRTTLDLRHRLISRIDRPFQQGRTSMVPRMFQSSAGLWSLKTGLMAAVALLGATASCHAQCSGGGGGGGGRGGAGGGTGAGGTSAVSQAVAATQSIQYSQAASQAAANQYVAGLQAQHTMMLQQIHQRQFQQLMATRAAHQKKKRSLDEGTVQVSLKTKSKTAKSSKATGPST